MTFKSISISSACMLLLGLFPVFGDTDAPLWVLDLGGQRVGPAPSFGERLEVREEDGQKILSKQNVETALFPVNIPSRQETKNWNDIIFRVRFREQERFGTMLVVKKEGDREGVDYMWYYILIDADKIGISCHVPKDSTQDQSDPRVRSAVKFRDMGEGPLGLDEWITVEAMVGNDVIKVKVDNGDGGSRQAEFKTFPGAGGVMLYSNTIVDIASASATQSETLIVPSQD